MSSAASSATDAVTAAPGAVATKAQGNPLAAGMIAFGAGLLAASLITASQKEQEITGRVEETARDAAQPVVEAAKESAQQIAGELKPAAQDAVQQVKESASQAVDTTKEQAQSAAQDVKETAQDSATQVHQTATT